MSLRDTVRYVVHSGVLVCGEVSHCVCGEVEVVVVVVVADYAFARGTFLGSLFFLRC